MIYNRLLSKYFPSPVKQRLFFFFKWRKLPATQYPRTPVGSGVFLITWAGFCSHIYLPLCLELAADFKGAVSDYLMHRSLLNDIWIWTKMAENSFFTEVNTLLHCLPTCYAVNICMLCCGFQLLQACELSIILFADRRWWLKKQLPVYVTPDLIMAWTF